MKKQNALVGAILMLSSLLCLPNAFAQPKNVLVVGLGGEAKGTKNGLYYHLISRSRVPGCHYRKENDDFMNSCLSSIPHTQEIQKKVMAAYFVRYKHQWAYCKYKISTALIPDSTGSNKEACENKITLLRARGDSGLCKRIATFSLSAPNGCSTSINFL